MDFLKGLTVPTVATILSAVSAGKEFAYWRDHPYARGPSGVITLLAVAALLLSLRALALAWEEEEKSRRFMREAKERSQRNDDR